MKIYHYDSQTGVFICEGEADLSPLEQDVWLIPAHATELEPPQTEDGYRAVFQDGAWSIEADPQPQEPVEQNVEALLPVPNMEARKSALAKLLALGLTEEEIGAL